MNIQIDRAALARRAAVLDEIGVGPLWMRRDTVIDEMPSSTQMPASAPVLRSTPVSTAEPAIAPLISRSADDTAWDDGSVHAMAAAPVKTILTLCTSADVADTARYLFVARASSMQGSEELFDNILRALGMQKDTGSQGDLAGLPAQIAAHRPSVVIAMGPAAALQLIGDAAAETAAAEDKTTEDRKAGSQDAGNENAVFESLRGRLHRIDTLAVLVTYEATHLLRHPGDKRKAWDDLCLLKHLQAFDVVDPA